MLLTSLLRRHLLGMGLTASALSTAPAAKGAIRYRQLWVSADGVTHIDEHQCGKLETKDFTSTGGDAALPESASFRPPRQRRDACLTQAIRARLLQFGRLRAHGPRRHAAGRREPVALLPLAAVRRNAGGKLVHPHERWQDHNVSTRRRLVSGASQRPSSCPFGASRRWRPRRRTTPRTPSTRRESVTIVPHAGQLRGAPIGQTRSEWPGAQRRAALERRERRTLQPARPRREAPRVSLHKSWNLVSVLPY